MTTFGRRVAGPWGRPAGAAPDMTDVEIFISHRSDDNRCGNVLRFREDLEKQLKLEGLHSPRVFLSSSDLPTGVSWQEELKDRLNSAQVFLALLSPGYFMSDVCSKEWRFFEKRMELDGRGTGLVQPVLWSPKAHLELPGGMQDLRFEIGGKRCDDMGLQRLMVADPMAYGDILRQLAREIVRQLDEGGLDIAAELSEPYSRWQPKFSYRLTPAELRVLVLHSASATEAQIDRFTTDLVSYLGFVGRPGSNIVIADVDGLARDDKWVVERQNDLRRCHVFVPLLNRNFGGSVDAAKAWGLMEKRMTEQHRGGGQRFVMPVLWWPPESISIVKQIEAVYQLGNGDAEQTYVKYGLHQLMEDMDRRQGEYEMQMWRFAEGIANTFPGDRSPDEIMPEMPAGLDISYDSCDMFFKPRRDRKRGKPRPVGLVRVAAHLGELSPNEFAPRRSPKLYYGSHRNEWRPYSSHKAPGEHVIEQAKSAVRSAERRGDRTRMADASVVFEIDDINDVSRVLGKLDRRTPIVVLDAFMLGSEVRREALFSFLAESVKRGLSCEVLVPNHPGDRQIGRLVGEGFTIVSGGPAGPGASGTFASVREWIGDAHKVMTPENSTKFYELVRESATLKGPLPRA